MRVLLRVEAGPQIGLGHLQRSLSLAAALKQQGIESRFLLSGSAENRAYVERFGFTGEDLPEGDAWGLADLQNLLEKSTRFSARIIGVDSPRVPVDYLDGLKRAGRFVMVRDDVGAAPFLPAHIVLNGNADAQQLRYEGNDPETLFLLGPQYAVLPEEFWNPAPRAERETVREVLVTLGGEDSATLMPRLIRLLDDLPGSFCVTAVIGPFFRSRAEVESVARHARREVRRVESPDSLYDWMRQADLAVSAAGQTLYELACVGCPTVGVRMAGNQEGQLRAFVAAGVVWPGGSMEKDGDVSEVQAGIGQLLANPGARAAMSAAGRGLIDGAGARRVADAISREVMRRANA